MTHKFGLKPKITIAVSILFILLMFGVTFVMLSYFEKQLKDTIAKNQFVMVTGLANELDSRLTMSQRQLTAAALMISPAVLSDPDRAQAYLDGMLGLHRIFDCQVAIFTPEGKILAESPFLPGRRGMDISFRPYYKDTVASLAPVIAEPYLSSVEQNNPLLRMTAPVFNEKGSLVAILSGGINLLGGNIFDDLSRIIIGRAGYLFMTTRASRLMIMHPEAKRILTLMQPGMNLLFDKAVDGFEGTDETVNSYGVRMLTSFKRLEVTNWILGANYPASEAHEIILLLKEKFFLAASIGIICVVIIVFFLIKYLTTSLVAFTRHIETLPERTGTAKLIAVRTGDEIGTLSQAFNRMIGELDRQKDALQKSEERYRTIYDSSNEAILIQDKDTGAIVDVNQRLCEMTGFSKEEARRVDVGVFGSGEPPYTLENALEWISKATQGEPQFFEWRAKHKSGQLFWVEVKMKCVEIDGTDRILTTASDINERKQAEAERAVLKDKLLQAQKMEAVGALAGGIAHDFNNILSAILGFTELAKNSNPANQQLQEDLGEVYTAGLRAKELVQQILVFSRKKKHSPYPLHVPTFIKEALKLIRSTLPASIEMKVDIDEGVGPVLADPTQIHQIVMNLCTNAGQAMDKNGGILTVQVSEATPSDHFFMNHPNLARGRYIKLVVQDTGSGIAPGIMDSIFDPYFTTKNQGDGTGLGLAVIYGIIQEIGGDIEVRSAPGKGSIFTAFLPVTTQGIKDTTVSDSFDSSVLAGNEHILLVDDEPQILKFTKKILESEGYTVTTASDGQSAFEKFKQNPVAFDLVISDVSMPKLSGDKLAQQILGIRPTVPILLASGYSQNISEESALQIGVKGLLQKPISREQLLTKVNQVL